MIKAHRATLDIMTQESSEEKENQNVTEQQPEKENILGSAGRANSSPQL